MKWNFNCFAVGSGRKQVKASGSVSESFKRPSSKPKIESGYAQESREKAEAFVRIVSFSHREEVIPVAVVSPIRKSSHEKPAATFDAQVSVKSQKAKGFPASDAKIEEDKTRKLDHQSWVRIVVKESALSTKKKRQGRQVVAEDGETKKRALQKVRNASRDSTPGPCPAGRKTKSIDFKGKVRHDHDSPHTRPPKQDKIHVSAMSAAITSKASATVVSESKECVRNFPRGKTEGCNVTICVSILIIVMGFLALSGKFTAIACTVTWCYAVPILRSMAKFEDPVGVNMGFKETDQKSERKQPCFLFRQSNDYKNKIVMEGLFR